MENKNVGYILLGVSALMVGIIFLFNNAMKRIIDNGCSMMHDLGYCPAYLTINQQTYLSLVIVGVLVIISLVLVFSKPQEMVIVKTVEKKPKKKVINTKDMNTEERQVFDLIQTNKTIFQAELIEKTGLSKAKMTRIIDRLEGKGLVERKRRGMTNVVVIKN